ncbi:MAG: DNA polymerase [Candidatus Paceibacterota bacterium]
MFLTNKSEALENKDKLNSSELKIGFDLKSLIKELKNKNLELAGPIFDLKIAGWLLDPDQKDYSLEALSRRFLRRWTPDSREIFTALFDYFDKKIKEFGLVKVFEEIEMPLVKVLAEMEAKGILVDKAALANLKKELEKDIKNLEEKIYKLSGMVFNLNSPKQLAEVLFEKLKIGSGKKRSTEAQYLTSLKQEHPVIGPVLEYRELFKIKSGFVEPIIGYLGRDSRLRTTFNQTGTATGRLSSEKPNLQNIPVGSAWASKLRSAFTAAPGFSLAAFDYSQIELRILASVSQDEKLKQAFFENQDIHRLTASQVFNVGLGEVTPAMRQLGKTLNFGIIYGMGANAFARTAGLDKEKARNFIDEYFSDFPEVQKWQEEVKAQARNFGYVKNLNGRRRWFLEMTSSLSRYQSEEERAAINMPIQGLAADIIKMAMIKTNQLGDGVRLLLSIHDELLFEIKDDILNKTVDLIKKTMEGVSKLDVPLKVEVKTGKNWGELKNHENQNH